MDMEAKASALHDQSELFRWSHPDQRKSLLKEAGDLYLKAAKEVPTPNCPKKWALVRLAMSCLFESGRTLEACSITKDAISNPHTPDTIRIQLEIMHRGFLENMFKISEPRWNSAWPTEGDIAIDFAEAVPVVSKVTLSKSNLSPNPKKVGLREVLKDLR